MSDQPSDQMSRSEKLILFGVVVPITAIAIFLWYFDLAYFVPHVAITRVHATNWRAGEYQNCVVANEKSNEQEPELTCSSNESEATETLKVRFYGRTFDPRQPGPAVFFIWRCRKNEGSDPSITCDHEKIGTIPRSSPDKK